MEKVYTVGQFAKMVGRSVNTLQRWDRDGILRAYRSPSKRRYYTHTQYLEYMGITITEDKQNVIYARVSTKNQKDDLENQIKFLVDYCHGQGINISNIYTDYGSGLNYNRKNWNRLIDDCMDGKIKNIYIAHSDRFVRFGYKWIVSFIHKYTRVNVISVDDIVLSPEDEIIQDLISIIHVFSCRIYGLQKYKKKLVKEFNHHEESM